MNKKEIKKVLPVVLLSTAVASVGFVGCSKSKDIKNNNLSFDHDDLEIEAVQENNDVSENNNQAGIIDVKYDKDSGYHLGGGFNFKILESTGEATLLRLISLLEDDNDELKGKVYIEAIRADGKEYPVTKVGPSAFNNCKELTSVNLPNVKKIGQEVFIGCSSLTEVRLPELKEVGSNLFVDCNSLTTVELSYVKTFDKLSEGDKKRIKNKRLIFSGSEPEEYNCEGIIYELNHKNKTAKIIKANENIRKNNLEIDTVKFYNNEYKIIEIGDSAFLACKGLRGILTIGNSVKSIGDRAFGLCSGLTGEFRILGSVTRIGECTFEKCKGLTEITIPDSVTWIAAGAFFKCGAEINIPVGKKLYIDKNYNEVYEGELKYGPEVDVYIN